MRARAWRLQAGEHALHLDRGGAPPPGPAEGSPSDFFPGQATTSATTTAMEYSFVRGGLAEPGPGHGLDAHARAARGRRGAGARSSAC